LSYVLKKSKCRFENFCKNRDNRLRSNFRTEAARMQLSPYIAMWMKNDENIRWISTTKLNAI